MSAGSTWKGIASIVLDAAGVVEDGDLVRLPYRERDGRMRFWRVKAVSGREWFDPSPSSVGGLIPLGLETLPRSGVGACVFIAEGESDALALRDHFAWWASFPAGVFAVALPGADSWADEWRVYFEPFPIVFVIGDADAAGLRMVFAVKRSLPWARVVQLPDGEDARSIVQRGGGDELLPYLEDADRLSRLDRAIRHGLELSDVFPARDQLQKGR